jgi:asparagine synthase (glutamine-hydrolysing)
MCGLVGYAKAVNSGEVQAQDHLRLKLACERLHHRGPDDHGLFEDPSAGVGLGHTRLSILDLSPLGHQPMASDDGQVVLAFNGEIYNFPTLRSGLEAQGHRFRGHSDTEVLLRLYLAWRDTSSSLEAFLGRLNGIFAFALWDRSSGQLLLARDALGVKPLYYCPSRGQVLFASEIKALMPWLAPGEASPIQGATNLDPAALERYLTFLWCPGAGTPFRGVRKLGPGEALWVQEGHITDHLRWCPLPAAPLRPSARTRTPTRAIQDTRILLRQAVHRQMVADVPVGAFLSGGIDSTSVVALARELNPAIRCFSIELAGGQEEGFPDDLPYARLMANHLQVPLDVVKVDPSRMAAALPQMVRQLDEPLADLAPLNVLFISQLARQQGIKVLLSGTGGDDLFSGYRRHDALQREYLWSWLPARWRTCLFQGLSALPQSRPLIRRLARLSRTAALSGDARLVDYFRWLPWQDLNALYSPELRQALSQPPLSPAEEPMLDFLRSLPDSATALDRMLALEQQFFLADHNLIYTDKMAMATGVEVRVPFLDLDLVAFARTLPDSLKFRAGTTKWVLRQAMQPDLPREILHRSKAGFGAPLRRWLQADLRDLLEELLSPTSLRARGLFDPAAVRRLIIANDTGRLDASYTLLSLMCIELWFRHFLDGQLSPPELTIGSKP